MARYDWDAIYKDWRTNTFSDAELSRIYGCSRTAIQKRAKKYGWVRDLSDDVRRATNAKLIQGDSEVARGVAPATAQEAIDAASSVRIEVVRGHRKTLKHGHAIVNLLMSQLNEAATIRDEIEEEVIKDTEPPEAASAATVRSEMSRRKSMLKAISLPAHAAVTRDLSTALKNLIPLERQAFALDKESPDDPDDGNDFTPAEKAALKKAAKNISKGVKNG